MRRHYARLVGVFAADKVPGPYQGFVRHRAFIEGRELQGGEEVAVLAIGGTSSFFAVFGDTLDLERLRQELDGQRAQLPPEEEGALLRALEAQTT